jgi:signal transduction histidine kinase
MAGLGTLAAGLAHELNNPAAAVRRATSQLRELLVRWQQAMSALDSLQLDQHQEEHVAELRADMARRANKPAELDPVTRSDRESAVETWLEHNGAAKPWEIAPTLVSFDWQVDEFEHLAEHFDEKSLSVIAQSLGIGSAVLALLDEVATGSERISEIVKAVKSYSYLDRAPVQEVDVREGLDSTVVILRHKLSKTTIMVTREYATDLPRIEAFAGELNQVWTNILDNAIDAPAKGEIKIHTGRRPGGGRAGRQRVGHPAGNQGAGIRAVLHHQAAGRRHWAGAEYSLQHYQQTLWRNSAGGRTW